MCSDADSRDTSGGSQPIEVGGFEIRPDEGLRAMRERWLSEQATAGTTEGSTFCGPVEDVPHRCGNDGAEHYEGQCMWLSFLPNERKPEPGNYIASTPGYNIVFLCLGEDDKPLHHLGQSVYVRLVAQRDENNRPKSDNGRVRHVMYNAEPVRGHTELGERWYPEGGGKFVKREVLLNWRGEVTDTGKTLETSCRGDRVRQGLRTVGVGVSSGMEQIDWESAMLTLRVSQEYAVADFKESSPRGTWTRTSQTEFEYSELTEPISGIRLTGGRHTLWLPGNTDMCGWPFADLFPTDRAVDTVSIGVRCIHDGRTYEVSVNARWCDLPPEARDLIYSYYPLCGCGGARNYKDGPPHCDKVAEKRPASTESLAALAERFKRKSREERLR